VAGAAAGDAHDWLPLRARWEARLRRRLGDELWNVGYFEGGALDPRLTGCVVQIVSVATSVATGGPWPLELPATSELPSTSGPEAPLDVAGVRFRVQRLEDDGFVASEWDGLRQVRLSLRLGSRATLRAHARRGDGDEWAIRLYGLLEVLRDWTPEAYRGEKS
jgi:hypothetical protein